MCKESGLYLGETLKPLSNFYIGKTPGRCHISAVYLCEMVYTPWLVTRSVDCGVVNLDCCSSDGSRWVASWIDGPTAGYFDSYSLYGS